jgi:hypothetical protein
VAPTKRPTSPAVGRNVCQTTAKSVKAWTRARSSRPCEFPANQPNLRRMRPRLENRGAPGSSPGLAIHERPAEARFLRAAAPEATSARTLPSAFPAVQPLGPADRPSMRDAGRSPPPPTRRAARADRRPGGEVDPRETEQPGGDQGHAARGPANEVERERDHQASAITSSAGKSAVTSMRHAARSSHFAARRSPRARSSRRPCQVDLPWPRHRDQAQPSRRSRLVARARPLSRRRARRRRPARPARSWRQGSGSGRRARRIPGSPSGRDRGTAATC